MKKQELARLSDLIVEAAAAKKAANIKTFLLPAGSPVTDRIIILTGKNIPQLETLAEYIKEQVGTSLKTWPRQQGDPDSGWIILDYGIIIAHIMGEAARIYYDLDGLLGDTGITYHF